MPAPGRTGEDEVGVTPGRWSCGGSLNPLGKPVTAGPGDDTPPGVNAPGVNGPCPRD